MFSKFVKLEDTMFFDLLYDLLDNTTFLNDRVSPPDLAGSTPGTAILSPRVELTKLLNMGVGVRFDLMTGWPSGLRRHRMNW